MSSLVVFVGGTMVFAGVLLLAMECESERAWQLIEKGVETMTFVVIGYQAARGLPKLGDALSSRRAAPEE